MNDMQWVDDRLLKDKNAYWKNDRCLCEVGYQAAKERDAEGFFHPCVLKGGDEL